MLSTGKYRRLVVTAKDHGFAVWLIYVVLDTPERNIERVRIRLKKGGHDVPEAKIRSRRERSLAQSPRFLQQPDAAWLYDNSGARLRGIVEKQDGTVKTGEHALEGGVNAIRTINDRLV